MSDDTSTTGPAADETPDETTSETREETPAGEARPGETGGDDGGAALERAQEAIDEAQEAEGAVAAHDDITSRDDTMAGAYSEDPGGEDGHP